MRRKKSVLGVSPPDSDLKDLDPVAPKKENSGIPKRGTNKSYRDEEYLEEKEVMDLADCAGQRARGANKLRDQLLIMMAFYHGLRANEAVNLHWSDVHLDKGVIRIRRLKGGTDTSHPIYRGERGLLEALPHRSGPVFINEQGAALSAAGFARILERTAKAYGLPNKPHPHMLRHSCGFWLFNREVELRKIQVYLGHRSIVSTTIYTQPRKDAFMGFANLDPFG